MIITETTQCSKRPAAGDLKGLLLAQNLEKGRTPSRPSSCTIRPCEKITERTFPNADKATKTDMTRSAREPNMFPKNVAATMLPDARNWSFGTAAK